MQISDRKLVMLLLGLLVISLLACGLVWLLSSGGTRVVVTINGQEYGSYDLHTDRVVEIAPEGTSWHNTLTIQGGKAWISESNCSNQICVKTPALTEDIIGMVVCLPHRLVVELKE